MKRLALVALLWGTSALFAQSFKFEDDRTVGIKAGEGQSTVVAPGHKDCAGGRILVSTDFGPGKTGAIAYRDLNGTETKFSVLDALPAGTQTNYNFGTSDHDLVSLTNGDVYYLTGALSRMPLQPTTAWFDSAYRWSFGPGARSGLLVWRSTDCGQHFQYMADMEFDSAKVGDGSCAMPQGRLTHRHSAIDTHYLAGSNSLAQPADNRFRFCWKCLQLFLADPGQPSLCPRGGAHESGGGIYKLTTSDVSGHANESNFKRCKRCGTLFRGNATKTACTVQTHDGGGSDVYFLPWGDTPLPVTEQGWRWCSKCQTMIHSASNTTCPLGGTHDLSVSAKYQMPLHAFKGTGEHDWARCSKCNAVYKPGAKGNFCKSTGDVHTNSGVTMTMLTQQPAGVNGQSGWRRCKRCGVLFMGDNEATSWCPLVRAHDGAGSLDYHLAIDEGPATAKESLQADWRACRKCGTVYFGGTVGGSCPIPGPHDTPIFDMGGSDGQLVKVDPALDRMYLTFQCVGRLQNKTSPKFDLAGGAVNQTVVAMSDKGSSWKVIGMPATRGWRMGIVPFDQLTFAIGSGLSDFFMRVNGSLTGKWTFASQVAEPAPGQWGYDDVDLSKGATASLRANIHAHTIVARTPGTSRAVMIMPDTIPSQGHGYRIFFEGTGPKPFTEASTPITPATKSPDDVVFHLQAIHLGVAGPVLLYWYDFDSTAQTIAIRGRFIVGDGKYTKDFTLSRAGGTPRTFPATTSMSYGDYQTAGGYIQSQSAFIFHPMWVEAPDNTVHYGTVIYNPFGLAKNDTILSATKPAQLQKITPINQLKVTPQATEAQEEHTRPRRE
jgi:hypothetical protein